ncbi:endonuclease III [Oscillospiraceae bacterium LCP25S3_F9]
MTDKERALAAVDALKKEYPDAVCSLVYTQPLQLLIATRLAAQCTDARVNMVTPKLFDTYKTVDDFAQANVEDVQQLIKSCGLYKTKAKDIVAMCAALRDKFGGNVPDTVEQLVTLPGVGRKTANLVVGDIFNKPAVVVDTHCIRITSRLGFHSIKDATKIEKILRELLPPDESNDFCHRIVLHGRAVCTARSPKCSICCMQGFCPSAFKVENKTNTKNKNKTKGEI